VSTYNYFYYKRNSQKELTVVG